jgi:parallel beta-helix repeat protein
MKRCAAQIDNNCKKIKLLDERTNELSRCYVKEEEKIPYVFTAPPRNRYFAGRTEEIQELKRILKVEETLNEKKVRVAAVCGLGGIGKTSLVSEYAHQMKDFYKGGVYWLSAEDDTFLEKTVNDMALKIDALLGSFDLTLSNTLKKISSSHDPNLIVLDCLDQLELSPKMMKFLSCPSQENIFAHFLVLTRRNPNRLVNEVSVFEIDSCLQLKCFQSQEAKQFVFSRTNVVREANVESVAESLCEELGRLPLALEQAGGYIRTRGCSFSMYLEQYKAERLRLLNRQSARASGNDSRERLAVHTTWLINMEYMKKSPDGQTAVRFMNACSFFDGNEIEEELINVGKPEVEDVAYRKCVSSLLGCREVLKLLTDFSLFTYVQAHSSSVSTHRLVQELVRESLNPESKAESFTDAVRMLSYAFSKCSSPSNLVSPGEKNDEEQAISFSDLPTNPSVYYMWSKFCIHGHHLRRNMKDLLINLESVCLDSVWFPETAKILYECSAHLSANHQQEEAKRTLNFAYRILDWLSLAEYETMEKNVSRNSLFLLSIPLPKSFQILIKRCCMPPFVSHRPLPENPGPGASGSELEEKIEKLKLDGNKSFKEGRYKEALGAYSSAINLAQDHNNAFFNPLLLTNRATVYIKLKQFEDALKDANDYITRRPDCWKGYARKALALDGLNEKVSAEIAAAFAFYHSRAIFSDFLPFKKSFAALQERIFICDFVDELRKAIFSKEIEAGLLKILVLGSEEYILNFEIPEIWSNCILVGTRKNCSVSLMSSHSIYLLKCMLTNLSFHLINSQLMCMPGSFVKVFNCNFASYDYGEEMAAVSTSGEFNAEHCNFTSTDDAGLICAGAGDAVVVDCSFCNNRKAGLEVRKGGTLIVKSSRMYNNGQDRLMINKASKCVALNCDMHDNDNSGISMVDSKNVTLIRNNGFDNHNDGIYMINSEANIKENNFFDNCSWGIWAQSNSKCDISMNRVFRNKAGGVRVGYRAEGKEFSPSIVELNKIYDNIGPGFVENVRLSEVEGSEYKNDDLRKSFLKSVNCLQSAKCQDNEVYHNKEGGMLNVSVPFCSNCRQKCEPEWCEKCFTSAYCNKSCQENHYSKHEKLCNILREKSSYLVTSVKSASRFRLIERDEEPKETCPNFSTRPPRDVTRFVVEVRADMRSEILTLYVHSRKVCTTFNSNVVFELVKEFGVICKQNYVEKNLFFPGVFEDNGQLRLFTNEFQDFNTIYSNIFC